MGYVLSPMHRNYMKLCRVRLPSDCWKIGRAEKRAGTTSGFSGVKLPQAICCGGSTADNTSFRTADLRTRRSDSESQNSILKYALTLEAARFGILAQPKPAQIRRQQQRGSHQDGPLQGQPCERKSFTSLHAIKLFGARRLNFRIFE